VGTAVVSAAVNAKPSEALLTEEIAQFTLIFQPPPGFDDFAPKTAIFGAACRLERRPG
jgi:hypothetical protein